MRVQAMGLLGALMLSAVGCGEITASDTADVGGADAGPQAGSGGHMFGTGGYSGGTGGARGTGGMTAVVGTGGAPADFPSCLPVQMLSVSSCDYLQPDGTYAQRKKNGHICSLCDPFKPGGPPISNFPCLAINELCLHACQDCD